MTGRGRSTRAGARADSAAAASPPRRATRQTPASEDGALMPPPPVTQANRSGRATRGQTKESEPARVSQPSSDAPPAAGSQVGSTQEDAPESEELYQDAPERMVAESESLGVLPQTQNDGGSEYLDSQSHDRYAQSRRVASTPTGTARSDVYAMTPGGARAKASMLQDLMPDLLRFADKVQQRLYSYFREDPTWKIGYDKFLTLFNECREEYQEDGFYINAASVIATLGINPDDMRAFHASKVVSAANIASLLADIHDADQRGWDAPGLLPSVQAWDEAFPSKFLPYRDENDVRWMDESDTIELALRLRIQRTIYTFEDMGQERDALSLIDAIWVDPTGLSPRQELLAFLSGNSGADAIEIKKGLGGVFLKDARYTELRDRYITEVRKLHSAITSAQLPSAVADLKKTYPIDTLAKDLEKWSRALFERICRVLDPARASTMPRDTPSVMASQMGDSQADSPVDPHMFAPPEARPAAYAGADFRDLQQIGAFDSQSQADASQSPRTAGFGSQAAQSYGSSISESAILQARIDLMPSSVATYQRPSQYGYSQPPPVSGQHDPGMQFAHSAAQAAGSSFATPSPSHNVHGKRPRDTQDTDDGFETDNRTPNSRRRAPAADTPRPRKRARAKKPPIVPNTHGTEGSQGPPPPPPTFEDLESLSQRAREVTAANRRPKEPQTRTQWSREDTRELIKAIGLYNAKWSLIESQAKAGVLHFQRQCNQQGLRDKARLIKVDFLKADQPLPMGFDFVVLGKKEKAIVVACHKNPARMEADLDDTGKPINTLYIPPDPNAPLAAPATPAAPAE